MVLFLSHENKKAIGISLWNLTIHRLGMFSHGVFVCIYPSNCAIVNQYLQMLVVHYHEKNCLEDKGRHNDACIVWTAIGDIPQNLLEVLRARDFVLNWYSHVMKNNWVRIFGWDNNSVWFLIYCTTILYDICTTMHWGLTTIYPQCFTLRYSFSGIFYIRFFWGKVDVVLVMKYEMC